MSDGFLFEGTEKTKEHFPNLLDLLKQTVSGDESHAYGQQELGL